MWLLKIVRLIASDDLAWHARDDLFWPVQFLNLKVRQRAHGTLQKSRFCVSETILLSSTLPPHPKEVGDGTALNWLIKYKVEVYSSDSMLLFRSICPLPLCALSKTLSKSLSHICELCVIHQKFKNLLAGWNTAGCISCAELAHMVSRGGYRCGKLVCVVALRTQRVLQRRELSVFRGGSGDPRSALVSCLLGRQPTCP
jgi:hypothetical protein